QVVRIRHRASRDSPRPPNAQELARRVKNLNSMITAIRDVDPLLVVDRQRPGPHEFTWVQAVPTPLEEPPPLGREHLDAVSPAVLGDVKVPHAVDDEGWGVAETSRGCPLYAVADLEQQFGLLRIDEHAIEVRVGDQQPPQPVNGQAAGAIDVELGGSPAAEIM